MTINKKGILIGSILVSTFIPASLISDMFKPGLFGSGILLLSLVFMMGGFAMIGWSLDIPSPLSFLHRRDDEIIERLNNIEQKLNK